MVNVFSENELAEIYGKKMKEYRVRAKLSQEKLAKLLNISLSTYVRYEQGITLIPATTLHRLIVTLNIPAGVFFPNSGVSSENGNVIDALRRDLEELQTIINRILSTFTMRFSPAC